MSNSDPGNISGIPQVNSVRDLYVCTHPVDAREKLQESIDRFYRGGEGRGWLVDNPRPGRFYAAPYEKEGYHRALLRKLVSRAAKCHRYGRYIFVKILEGWGKKCGRPRSFLKLSSFGVHSTNLYEVSS